MSMALIRSTRRRSGLLREVGSEARRHAASAVRFNIAIAQRIGMPLADVQCLGLLRDGPSTPSALAGGLGLTTGAATKLLDRLEQAGFVTRAPDENDRRSVIIAAVPRRLAALEHHFEPMGARLTRLLAECSNAELVVILRFMRAGRQASEDEIALLRSGGKSSKR